MDSADQTGNSREVYRQSKQLASNKSGKSFIQPTTDLQGEQIVSSDQQLSAWADFLEAKFSSRENEPDVVLTDDHQEIPEIELNEVAICVKKTQNQQSARP